MPWNLPFQFALGIQTSNLISESLVGLITPATRQNAGKSLYGVAEPVGGANAPAATDCAAVIVVLGSFNSASPSHVAAETEPPSAKDSVISGSAANHCRRNLRRDVLFMRASQIYEKEFQPRMNRNVHE